MYYTFRGLHTYVKNGESLINSKTKPYSIRQLLAAFMVVLII